MPKATQTRSQLSEEKIIDAAEELLDEKPFERIKVAELASRAGVTTGAIYGRFESKDGLLPALYKRFDRRLDDSIADGFKRHRWSRMTPASACEHLATLIMDFYADKPGLTRAMAIFARSQPELLPPSAVHRSRKYYECAQQALSPHVAGHIDIEFAVYAAMTIAREQILFGTAPLAAAQSGRVRLHCKLSRMLQCLLEI